jgi:hypothetical protein
MLSGSMETEALRSRIAALQLEHRDLDLVIARLSSEPMHDELQIRRLKKRKLQVKDQIMQLQIQLVPDITA